MQEKAIETRAGVSKDGLGVWQMPGGSDCRCGADGGGKIQPPQTVPADRSALTAQAVCSVQLIAQNGDGDRVDEATSHAGTGNRPDTV